MKSGRRSSFSEFVIIWTVVSVHDDCVSIAHISGCRIIIIIISRDLTITESAKNGPVARCIIVYSCWGRGRHGTVRNRSISFKMPSILSQHCPFSGKVSKRLQGTQRTHTAQRHTLKNKRKHSQPMSSGEQH